MVDVWSIVSNVLKGAAKYTLNKIKEKNEESSPSSEIEKQQEEERKRQEEEKKMQEEEKKKAEAEKKRLEAEEKKRKEEEKKLSEAQVAQKRQQEAEEKIKNDAVYREKIKKELNNSTEEADVWNTSELWWSQTWKSIQRSWEAFNKRRQQREAEKWTAPKGFFGTMKENLKEWIIWWADLWATIIKTAGKAIWWALDVAWEGTRTASDMIQHWSWDKWMSNYQKRVNDILVAHENEKNTVQNVATERMLDSSKNVDIAEQKYKDALDNYNNLEKELESIQNEVNELDKQRTNWAVTWPEWNTNYNARTKELKDKKKSVAEALLLLNNITEEYRTEINKHAEEEQKALPFTRGFYETQEEAKYYQEHFADKVYKNKDWKYYWIYVPAVTGDPEVDAANNYQFQKEQDIRSTIMNLENSLFQEMEWVRNQTEWVDDVFWWKTLATLWIWNTSRNYDFDFNMRADFLKNSDFLDRAASEFVNVRKLLEDNYDKLLSPRQWADWQMHNEFDLDKVYSLLQNNRAWLNRLWDEIVQKKANTQYVDYQTERWYKNNWDDSAIMWLQENAAKKKDLIFSYAESVSRWKTTTKGPQLFSYSRAWDWIAQATDNYWFKEAAWRMFASNPGQTAYVLWSTYFALFGKLGVGVKWVGFVKWKKLADWTRALWSFENITKPIGYTWVTRWSSKMQRIKSAEEAINNAQWIWKAWLWKEWLINWIDKAVRMWYWTVDEMLVSLPLDLWLSDWTATDMWMNIWFNTLWWIGKISSAPEMTKFTRNLTTKSSPEAMRQYFIDQTGLKELAYTIDFTQDSKKIAAEASEKITNHMQSLLSSDKNKAAFFMSQYLMWNIDNLKWEHADTIKIIADSITENGNIWTSLWKNRAKNIQNILNKANKELSETKDWVKVLSIQNRAIEQVRNEFKQLLETFDSNKIKKFFDHDFSREKIAQGYANFFQQLEDATWTSKEWWALTYLWTTSNNSRHSEEVVANLVEAYKKALSAWEVTTTKTNAEAVRTLAIYMWDEWKQDVDFLVKATNLWTQWKHEEAAELIQQVESQFLKEQRKINKAELDKVNKEVEKLDKKAEKEAKKAAKKAEQAAIQAAEKAKAAGNIEEKWRAVLDYAKKISEDKELKEEIENAKKDWYEEQLQDEALIEMAEERWITVEELIEKEWIKMDNNRINKIIEQKIIDKYFNIDYIKKRYGDDEEVLRDISEKLFGSSDYETTLKNISLDDLYRIDLYKEQKRAEAALVAIDDIKDIFRNNDKLWVKWWSSMSEKSKKAMEKAQNKEKDKLNVWLIEDESEAIWEGEVAKNMISKMNSWKRDIWLEWTYKFTDEEKNTLLEKIKLLEEPLEKISWKSKVWANWVNKQSEIYNRLLEIANKWEINKEEIKEVFDILWSDEKILDDLKNEYRTAVNWAQSWVLENPYKIFSRTVLNYIQNPKVMSSTVNPWNKEIKNVEGQVETEFAKTLSKDDKLERELEKIIDTITDADVAAKKAEAEKTVEEAAVKMDMTSEGKKAAWAYKKIIEWAEKFLDFMENSKTFTKNSWLDDAVSKILQQIKNVSTERRFLWSLGNIVEDMVSKAVKGSSKKENRTLFKSELWKALFDVIPEWNKTTFRNELKKVITDADWNIDLKSVEDIVWKKNYKLESSVYENMVKSNQTDELLNKIIQDKITSSLWKVRNQPLDWDKYGKVADYLNYIAEQGNELYRRLWTAVAQKYWIDAELFMEKMERANAIADIEKQRKWAKAKVELEAPDNKDIQAVQNLTKEVPTEEEKIAETIEDVVKDWDKAAEKKALSTENKEEKTNALKSDYKATTNKERTMARFWAYEEAANIMKAVSNGKVPETIWAEFLDNDWFEFLSNILKEAWMTSKEHKLFYEGFLKAKKQMQGFWYTAFYGLNHVLFNWNSLKTNAGWWNLSWLLKSIPVRITASIKWARTWGIIYDPRTTLTKYIMESNANEWREIMQKFLSEEYLPKALQKAFNDTTAADFLKATWTQLAEWESEASWVARALMWLYDNAASELRKAWMSERLVHDILNPILYNPMEYINGIGKSLGKLEEWAEVMSDSMILWTILRKYENQWNDLTEELIKLKVDNEANAKLFESFAWGSVIRNKYAYEVWEAFGNYLNKIDSIPMWKEQFAEYLNKTLGHIVNGWDDVVRWITAFDNALYPIMSKARKSLPEEEAQWFISRMWDMLNEWDSFYSKSSDTKKVLMENLEALTKEYNIADDETKAAMEAIKKSLDDVTESKDERVLVNYLYDSVTKRSNDYIEAMQKSDEKFNPADIINRKELQESVMEKYNEANKRNFARDLLEFWAEENKKAVVELTKKTRKWAETTFNKEITISENYANKERQKLIQDFWFTNEELDEIKEFSNIDLEEIVKMEWNIDPENWVKYMLDQLINGTADYTDLMNNEYVRKLLNDSLEKAFDKRSMKAWEEYFSVAKDGTFILRQEGIEMSAMEKFLANLTTRGNIMNRDRETRWILERLSKVRKTGYVKTNIDFKTILNKSDLAISNKWYVNLETYLSMTKKAVNELAWKINSNERSSVVQDVINKVFFNQSTAEVEARLAREDVKPLYNLMVNYKNEYWKMRKELWLWDNWNMVFNQTEFTKNWANKLWNRITWMWSYLSNEDINRLSIKYDSSRSTAGWVNGVWKNFTQDIIYNQRSDVSDNTAMWILNGLNNLSRNYVILRNYNVIQNWWKAGQQMVSNLLHSKWIRASTSIWGDPEVDKFLNKIQKSTANNFWFDLYGSEWVFGTKNAEKNITNWKRNKWWSISLDWMKKAWSTNSLMLWDMATKRAALKSSLSLALDDIYKVWGIDAVRDFETKFDKFQEYLKKYDLREWDFLDRERYSSKMKKNLTPDVWQTYEQVQKSFDEASFLREQDEMWNFYHNEYAPFMGKARNSMGIFFVMDDIAELGSINLVDKWKFFFWLMKWAVGKTGEYWFDLAAEFAKNGYGPKWIMKTLQSPIVKRVIAECWEWAHAMWELEKMTNHEFTVWDWLKATVVPIAAIMMLFWDSLIKSFEKNYSGLDWSIEDFAISTWWVIKDMADDIFKDRAFIYAWIFGTDFWRSWNTASAVAEPNDSAFYEAFAKTFYRKRRWSDSWRKFQNINSAWMKTDATELLNPGTILTELWLNQNSSRREQFTQVTEDIYNLGQFYYDEQNKTDKIDIASYIPVVSNFSTAWVDYWVMFDMLEERLKQSWAKAFLKSTASQSELLALIDKNEKNWIMNSKEVKKKLNEMWKDWKVLSEQEALEVMFRAGKYDLDLQSWSTVMDALKKEDTYWKWEYALWYSMLPEEDKQELQNQFNELYQKYVIDLNKWEVATTTMLDNFIKAASKYGGTMSMGWYMEAFMTGMKSRLRDAYGLNSKEVTAWGKWDEWLATENADFSNLEWSKVWAYVEYATTIRELEKQMIVNNWDWISREKNVWRDLLNKYIENDNENAFKKYTSSISQEKNNLAKLFNIKVYNDIAKEQWMPWLILPIAYQEKKAMDNYNLAIEKAKTPEEAAALTAQFLKIQTDLAWMADKYIDNPIASTLVKVSLAAGTIPFADTLREKNPELLEKVVDIIGEKAINNVLNVLTDSPTVAVADAFEMATSYNAHDWSWKWKGRRSTPSAKARENYVNKMLIPNYNKAKAAAWRWWSWGWSGSLPKFSTYARWKDWGIVSFKNPVSTVRKPTSTPLDEPKPEVDMTPLPVKEWRVIGWKYSARAIQNAKVYSRRIGR